MKASEKTALLSKQVDELTWAVAHLTKMVSEVNDKYNGLCDQLTLKTLRKLQEEDK